MPEARQVALKLASFLERLVEENNNIPCQPTMFDLTKNANISISDFMKRIVDYSYNSPESYVVSLILLEKYVANKENVLVNRFNIHK
jgi:hypothetical protein